MKLTFLLKEIKSRIMVEHLIIKKILMLIKMCDKFSLRNIMGLFKVKIILLLLGMS